MRRNKKIPADQPPATAAHATLETAFNTIIACRRYPMASHKPDQCRYSSYRTADLLPVAFLGKKESYDEKIN